MSETNLRRLLAELESDEPDTEALADELAKLERAEPGTVVPAFLALPDPNPPARWIIAHVLGDLAPDPAVLPGIPLLVRILRDPAEDEHTRFEAGSALANLGPAGIDTFLQLCRDVDPDVRARSAAELRNIGRYTDAVVAALLALLADPVPDVRLAAVESLSRCRDGRATAALAHALKDADGGTRMAAAQALLRLDARHVLALAAAAGGLRDESPAVRAAACDALEAAKEAAAPALAGLCESLADEDATVRERAAHTLMAMGAAALPAVVPLGKALHDSHARVTHWAGLALMRFDTAATPVADDLVEALRVRVANGRDPEDDAFHYLVYLMRSVGNIGQAASGAVPALEHARELVADLPDHLELAKWAIRHCRKRG